MDSKTGLIIQLSGITLLATLSFFLLRSLKSTALKYWTAGWFCLSFSLLSLTVAFSFEQVEKIFSTFYFFGEYVFCFFLIAGCRNYASGENLSWRKSWKLSLFAGLAALLSFYGKDFNEVFIIHSFVLGTYFVLSFVAIKAVQSQQKNNYGWYVMQVALALMAFSFYNYVLAFSLHFFELNNVVSPLVLAYNSIFDLISEITLGFGMVIVLLEEVRRNLEEAHGKLIETHAKLEEAIQTDPLTTAFNRHAFYGFINKEKTVVSGCVGVFDIDNLKPINDRYGHFAGDMAIRSVVCSIRTLIRAEDLIFRWGGDEFFVIMISMDSDMARERMQELSKLLSNIRLDGVVKRVTIGVSYGFADFVGTSELEQAIKKADDEMYLVKQQNKQSDVSEEIPFIPVAEAARDTSLTVN